MVYTMLINREDSVLERCHLSLNLSVAISIKSSAAFLSGHTCDEIDKLFLKFIWTYKGPKIARKILKEQNWKP